MKKKVIQLQKNGRPTKYSETMKTIALNLAQRGIIDSEIAEILGIAESTIHYWKNSIEGFSESLNASKRIADKKVEEALYHRARGMTVKEIKTHVIDNKVVKTEVEKAIPPDVTAAIFWLKNRLPGEWRDRSESHIEIETRKVHEAMNKLNPEKIREIIFNDPMMVFGEE